MQIAKDRTPAEPHLRGDGGNGPAGAVQGPHLLIEGLPAGRTLGGLLLHGRRRGWGWHRRRARPLGQRDRLLAHRLINGVEGLGMRRKDLVQRFGQVLEQMDTVGDLGGGGCPLARALGVGLRAITRDHFNPRMLSQPLGEGVGSAIREERDRLVTLQIDQHGPIGVALPQGKIVHAQDGGGGARRDRQLAEQAPQGVPADGQAELRAQQRARSPTEREGDRPQAVREPLRPSCPGGQQLRQALGKNTTRATPIGAEELPDAHLQQTWRCAHGRSATVRV